jgi:hypothetical protein
MAQYDLKEINVQGTHAPWPKRIVRQVGPLIWVYTSLFEQGGPGCTWLLVGHHSDAVVGHIAGDAVDAHDPMIGVNFKHPLPYPNDNYNKADIEQEAWQVIKYLPNAEGLKSITLYQMVGEYNVYHQAGDSALP